MIICKCPKCGAELKFSEERNFGFCEFCGERIELNNNGPSNQNKTEEINKLLKERKKSKVFETIAGIIIAILLIVLLALLGIKFFPNVEPFVKLKAAIVLLVNDPQALTVKNNSAESASGNSEQAGTPYIGISGTEISEEIKQTTGLSYGIRIYFIYDGSAAEEAGLRVGDVILSADGNVLKRFSDLSKVVNDSKPGTKLYLDIYREGKYLDIPVVVGIKAQLVSDSVDENTQVVDQQPTYIPDSSTGSSSYYNDIFPDGSMDDFFDYYFGR